MNAYKVGQAVELDSGARGTILEVYRASEKGAQRDMGFYLFRNGINGTTFTVGHTEIVRASTPAVTTTQPTPCQQQQANAGAGLARAEANLSEAVAAEIASAQKALDLYPDASPFWDSSEGQAVLESARRYNLRATNTNRERCRIHGDLMRLATDPNAALRAALADAIEGQHCRFDVLNPCWDNRPTDVVGRHWGGGDACPVCNALGVLAKVAA